MHKNYTAWGMTVSALLIALGLATAGWAADRALANGAAKRTFAEVVRTHFAEWDTNRDGKLEGKELDALMNRAGIHGEAAAALATIKRRERMAVVAEPGEYAVSEQKLLGDHADDGPVKSLDAARGEATEYRYEPHFQQDLALLAKINRRLYAGDGPNFAAMRQGGIGDCYFFSVTGNLAAHHPERIKRMIEPRPNNEFMVHLGDGESISVGALSDAEILVNNSASSLEDGLWLSVLEKAVGREMWRRAPPGKKTGEATDAMASGGSTAHIIQIFTGHQTDSITLRDPQHAKARMTELRERLPVALGAGHLVGVGMGKNPPEGHKKIPHLGYGHAYAVFKYDRAADQVTLWNPWGNDYSPQGKEGTENGFETRHGIFHVPLSTLYHQFSSVVFETNKKLAAQAHR
jgi:hypothetical protein